MRQPAARAMPCGGAAQRCERPDQRIGGGNGDRFMPAWLSLATRRAPMLEARTPHAHRATLLSDDSLGALPLGTVHPLTHILLLNERTRAETV